MSANADYRKVLGSVAGLRRGFTSGTSAQAASLAAAIMFTSGQPVSEAVITLKDGRQMAIPVVNTTITDDYAECGVIKDAGDDDDVTHGTEFRARVRFCDTPGVHILGGRGVGLVTRKGLAVPPGEPAVNPNPRRCIRRELEPYIPAGMGFEVTLSVPNGEELAAKTWNPRLGIEGGISIIGTTGVVEPKSDAAWKASIALNLKVLRKSGVDTAALAFGYVGENWYRREWNWGGDKIVKFGDHLGFAIDSAAGHGFTRLVLAGHVGKMTKAAAGLFDTHWSAGDARLETTAAWAGAVGANSALVSELLALKTVEAAVPLLAAHGLEGAWELMNRRLLERVRARLERGGYMPRFESILLDLKGGVLAYGHI